MESKKIYTTLGALIVAGGCVARPAMAADAASTRPAWDGVWALPDSTFGAAMGRIAHGNGPEAASYTPGYLESHGVFAGPPPGAGNGGPPPGGPPSAPKSGPGAPGEANAASCLPNGVPAVMGVPVGFEFLLTPGRLTILIEEGPTVRQVYLDRPKHTPDADPSYTGDSIGHWEGQTLVVDTIAISPKAQFFFGVPTTGKTHLIERIHLVDHDHLKVDTEVQDPIALQKPWHYSWTYVRTDTDFMANTCDRSTDRDRSGVPDLTLPPVQ